MKPPGLDIYDLSCFVAVAKRLNFTNAAKDLGISPPAISKRISAMEKTLCIKLFTRDTRRVILTPEGYGLLIVAKNILDQFEKIPEAIAVHRKDSQRSVTYGIPPWLHPELEARLDSLEQIYAGRVDLLRRVRDTREIIASIAREDAVFGLARSVPNSATLSSAVVREERIGAVLSRSMHGWRTSIPLSELLSFYYIGDRRDRHIEYQKQIERVLESTGSLKRSRLVPSDLAGIAEAIANGTAFTTVPLSAVAGSSLSNSPENVCVPIDGLEFTLKTCLVWNSALIAKNSSLRELIDTAIALCRGSLAHA